MNEEKDEEDGILGCIQKECLISASQELYLQNCSFAGESDLVLEYSDDDFTPWTNTHTQLDRIIMVSPPESPKDHEVFQTPPEGSIVDSSQEEAAAPAAAPVESVTVRDDYVDSMVEEDDEYAEAVNLDRDSDELGFPCVKLDQVSSNNVSVDTGTKPLEIETSIIKENGEEEEDALRKKRGSILGEDRRRLKRNGGEGTSSAAKSVADDIERFKYVSSSVVTRKRKEVSPAASIGRKANGVDIDTPPVIGNEIYKTLLDALIMIGRKKNDGSASPASASEEVDWLETARGRGIVFPRPRWWRRQPPEECDD